MEEKKPSLDNNPFRETHRERITLVETCEKCRNTTGCIVIIEKRLVEFRDECKQCPFKDAPDCKACCTARLAQVPTLCEKCKKEVS